MAALLAYLGATLGLALPHPIQKTGQPFPCQHHLCGCQTAEQCWRHCCCFGPEERRAWARENNVVVPADAEQPATKQSWCSVRLRDQAAGKKKAPAGGSCCASCDSKKTERSTPTRACCSRKAKAEGSSSVPAGRGGPTLSAFRCQGLTTFWISAGFVLTVPSGLDWNPVLTPFCTLTPASCRAERLPPEPLAPPPRFVSA